MFQFEPLHVAQTILKDIRRYYPKRYPFFMKSLNDKMCQMCIASMLDEARERLRGEFAVLTDVKISVARTLTEQWHEQENSKDKIA